MIININDDDDEPLDAYQSVYLFCFFIFVNYL